MIGHMGLIEIRLTDKTHFLPASNLEFSNHSETHGPPLRICVKQPLLNILLREGLNGIQSKAVENPVVY